MPTVKHPSSCEPMLQANRPHPRPQLSRARDEASGAGVSRGAALRVLIVEDDYLVSGEMEAELSAAGFQVVGIAASAAEAVRLAQAREPHLVVMDIALQGTGDGIDAALEIFRSKGIRSLFASAFHDAETRRRAQPAAPLGWLAKPYTMSLLVQAVRNAVLELGGRAGRP